MAQSQRGTDLGTRSRSHSLGDVVLFPLTDCAHELMVEICFCQKRTPTELENQSGIVFTIENIIELINHELIVIGDHGELILTAQGVDWGRKELGNGSE